MFLFFCFIFFCFLFLKLTAIGEIKKSIEDVMPIATGLEREEIEAELQVI
jgi:hypothetical protein